MTDESVTLAQATDATIDDAIEILNSTDTSGLPDDVQHAIALIQAAGVTADELLEALGAYDADIVDDEDDMSGERSADTKTLTRQFDFMADESRSGLTLEGIAAVYNDWTTIDSWEGNFRERIMPGAFDKTIRERKPVLMFNHGQHPLIGDMPIGAFDEIRSVDKGLYVRATLADNWLIEPVRDAIAQGALTGMSIRMEVVKQDFAKGADKLRERSIKEIKLHELGPVVFPAYENTEVSVRSREVVTALADPKVRADIARALAFGTGLLPAAGTDEPGLTHSTRTHSQRRALALIALSPKGQVQ